jgi:hypothetical protein
MKMQDDLIDMMSRNLQLSPLQHGHDLSMPPTPQAVPQSAPITYITQHYHHSAHQVPSHDLPASAILENAGINASALFPSQLQLFNNAEPQQKLRLIELWQIAPPTYGTQVHPDDLANWPQTSMEKEEEAAKYRLQESEQERLKSLSALPAPEVRSAEPYIVHGYDALPNINGMTAPMEFGSRVVKEEEYKPSTDPAYDSREWWHLSDEEPMEHQYGMLQQIYGYHYSAAAHGDGDAEMS